MDWTHIIVHHSATKDGITHDWEAIKNYHMSYRIDGVSVTLEEFEHRLLANPKQGTRFERPWSDIGYHRGIENRDGIFQIMEGRSLDVPGAHTVGMNHCAIGICCVGDYDNEPPPAEMIDLLISTLESLCKQFGIPKENIKRHSDYANKTCPGTMFDLEAVKGRIAV